MTPDSILQRALMVKDLHDRLFVPEANTESGLIPNSYIGEDGKRHATVWCEDYPDYARLVKVNGEWQLKNWSPF